MVISCENEFKAKWSKIDQLKKKENNLFYLQVGLAVVNNHLMTIGGFDVNSYI